jgi:hypothetical protein
MCILTNKTWSDIFPENEGRATGRPESGHQGSMLWSHSSAIFAIFRQKNWRFSQKPMLWSIFCKKRVVWAKNGNIFAKFFGESIFKIITSIPDGANLRPMGHSLLWAVAWKLQKYPTYFGYFIPWISFYKNFDKKMGWARFWAIFHKLIWSPCRARGKTFFPAKNRG